MKTESKYNHRTTTVAMNGECYNTWCGKDGYTTATTCATLNRTETTWNAVFRRPLHFVRRAPLHVKTLTVFNIGIYAKRLQRARVYTEKGC